MMVQTGRTTRAMLRAMDAAKSKLVLFVAASMTEIDRLKRAFPERPDGLHFSSVCHTSPLHPDISGLYALVVYDHAAIESVIEDIKERRLALLEKEEFLHALKKGQDAMDREAWRRDLHE